MKWRDWKLLFKELRPLDKDAVITYGTPLFYNLLQDPKEQRGKVALSRVSKGRGGKERKAGPAIVKSAERGAEIAERYTHPDLLPKLSIVGHSGRAFHRGGSSPTIHIGSKTSASVAAHEITHGTEQQTPSVLKKSRAFLKRRAGGKPTVSLRKATGQNYKAHERAWEDDWIAKGGRLYMGKDYGDRATEILTMGIERLHRNPQEFAMNDPDYFQFVIETLQTQ